MKLISHREYLGWVHWFHVRDAQPTDTHWYLMRVAQAMKGGKLDEFLLPWHRQTKPVQMTDEQVKQRSIARVGGNVTIVRGKRDGT